MKRKIILLKLVVLLGLPAYGAETIVCDQILPSDRLTSFSRYTITEENNTITQFEVARIDRSTGESLGRSYNSTNFIVPTQSDRTVNGLRRYTLIEEALLENSLQENAWKLTLYLPVVKSKIFNMIIAGTQPNQIDDLHRGFSQKLKCALLQ